MKTLQSMDGIAASIQRVGLVVLVALLCVMALLSPSGSSETDARMKEPRLAPAPSMQAIPRYRQAQAISEQRVRGAQGGPTARPAALPVPTPTEPGAACLTDANGNGYVDVLDIMTTAQSDTCQTYYLPLLTANWRQPWPLPALTPSPTTPPTSTPIPSPTATPDLVTVPRYGIFEQTFNWNSAGYSNPWEQAQVTMTLTSPTGSAVTLGGFYYESNTWKARFSPAEVGTWSWQATLTDGTHTSESAGSLTVVDSDRPGFVRSNPDNPFRWVFDACPEPCRRNGSPYYPIGIGDCIRDVDHSGSPLDNWGFDGEFRSPGGHNYGWIADIDTYLGAYSAAGVNLFRWSVNNCAFGLYETIDPSGNVYLVQEGLWGDELAQKLRQYGFRTYMVIFGFDPPFPDDAGDPARMAAVKRYVKYVVDRYGAYVDFWELMNEATVSNGWYNQIAQYLRSVDPYDHPISTSWAQPELAVIDINSPHWYQNEDEFQSDRVAQSRIDDWKAHGKPVILGEQGNAEQNWDERSALRMRIRSWTAFFREGVLIFWNSSFAKDYRGHGASNIYLGPEERGYLQIMQDFTRGLDPRITMVDLGMSDPTRVRGYALRSPTTYVAYLHAYTDHANPTTGISVMVDLLAGGTATWISPATGEVLGTQSISAGTHTLAVPAFTTDVVLKIQQPDGMQPECR